MERVHLALESRGFMRLRVENDFLDCVFPIILINKHSIYGKVI